MRMGRSALPLLLFLTAFAGFVETSSAEDRMTIYGTEKRFNMDPVLAAFRASHPAIRLDYIELDETELDSRYLAGEAAGKSGVDILLSSAMDRQIKLANDGHAATHTSASAQSMPPWARWRNQVFAFTFEPAVMVFNTDAMRGHDIPKSREELRETIRREPDFWSGRIGFVDIGQSSASFMIAAQEARQNRNFNLLLRALGDARSQIMGSSDEILQKISSGKLGLGYNILESEAHRYVIRGAPLTVVYPRDYTIAVLQTAIIPRNAPNPTAAHSFLEFLLSIEGQTPMEMSSRMTAIHPGANQDFERLSGADVQVGAFRPIVLGPHLLLYRDPFKRRHVLDNWYSLTVQEKPLIAAPQ